MLKGTGNYIAAFKFTQQISPDDFDVVLKTKICSKDTTIGEVVDWYKGLQGQKIIPEGISIQEEHEMIHEPEEELPF